jgi:chromosome partitioning protein
MGTGGILEGRQNGAEVEMFRKLYVSPIARLVVDESCRKSYGHAESDTSRRQRCDQVPVVEGVSPVGRIIAVANQKGGVGKTTTAVNLSACLAEAGKSVLLVDIDPQGNATSGLGIDRREVAGSVYDLLLEDANPVEIMVATQVEGLYVVPATIDLAGAEIELVPRISRENRLKKALLPARERFDYVLIDCPPSLGLLTINAFTAADSILIPIQCEYYALEGLTQLMDTFRLVREALNPDLEVEGALLTMFDARTNLSIQVVEDVKRFFKGKVYRSIITRNVRLSEAPSHGKPITLYDPRSRGAEAYCELAREVIEHGEERARQGA